MRRLSAALMLAIGAACARAQAPPTRAPVSEVKAPPPSVSAKPLPMPTTLLPGVGMSTTPPSSDDDDHDATMGSTVCAKDDDCWSRTCCPARAPEECVHASRARKCAIIDITCKPSPLHYTCVCDGGACKGRLAPP